MELTGSMAVISVLPLLARWLCPKFSETFRQIGFGNLSSRLAGNGNGNGNGSWVLEVGAASITQPVNPVTTQVFPSIGFSS
jgi:hypothetical protein